MTHYHILFRVSIYEGKTFFFKTEEEMGWGRGRGRENLF